MDGERGREGRQESLMTLQLLVPVVAVAVVAVVVHRVAVRCQIGMDFQRLRLQQKHHQKQSCPQC
jgi:hypothetical protein